MLALARRGGNCLDDWQRSLVPPVSANLIPTPWANGPKRVFDLVGAVLMLVLLSPVLVLSALAVKLTSQGSVFFRQRRIGRGGAAFEVVKFRTMRAARTPDPKELVPLNHPDITVIGFFLRRCKFDELPQLFNVLTGEMSLVGPRPTLPDQAAAYTEFQRQRLLVRPGVTGLAQVYGSARMPWDERIQYDVAYVQRCGLMLDLWILLRSPWVALVGEERTQRAFASSRFADRKANTA